MKQIRVIMVVTCLFVLFFFCINCTRDTLLSPDGNIKVKTRLGDRIEFSAAFRGKAILGPSSLEFVFKDAMPFGSDIIIDDVRMREINETWEPVLKKQKTVFNHCNETTFTLIEKNEPYRKAYLVFRIFDDGIAYMTEFPGSDTDTCLTLLEENFLFRFTGNHDCWAADYIHYTSSFESEFIKRRISEITDQMVIGLPITIKVDEKIWVAITEARLTDYAGMYLKHAGDSGEYTLRSQLAPLPGQDENGEKVQMNLPHRTPWRVIMIGETPGSLLESNLIMNLNDPCKLDDVSWIKPGMCAWDHWWSEDVLATTEAIKEYINLASEMGWPYQLIDWQWYGIPRSSALFRRDSDNITRSRSTIDMPGILDYAKSKGVRCWLWLHWRDLNRYNLDTIFSLYESWGIAGLKIDFMNRDDQEMVNWYRRVIETAARYHLMIIFHSSYKPTGIRRTLPNLLTREGVLGNEYNKESSRITPEHMVTIPFTRMLAGPMDFTPGGFLNRSPVHFIPQDTPATVQGTRCNTLAQFVVYESPLQIACDHPDHYRDEQGIDFLKSFPTIWDQSIVINGSIGEFITMARQSGAEWYVGAMNNSVPRELEINMSFLGEGSYHMISYADADDSDSNPEKLIRSDTIIDRESIVKIKMTVGGGFAAHLYPIQEEK